MSQKQAPSLLGLAGKSKSEFPGGYHLVALLGLSPSPSPTLPHCPIHLSPQPFPILPWPCFQILRRKGRSWLWVDLHRHHRKNSLGSCKVRIYCQSLWKSNQYCFGSGSYLSTGARQNHRGGVFMVSWFWLWGTQRSVPTSTEKILLWYCGYRQGWHRQLHTAPLPSLWGSTFTILVWMRKSAKETVLYFLIIKIYRLEFLRLEEGNWEFPKLHPKHSKL